MVIINDNIEVYFNTETSEFKIKQHGRLDTAISLTKDEAKELALYILNLHFL